jgi:hypothetical protein
MASILVHFPFPDLVIELTSSCSFNIDIVKQGLDSLNAKVVNLPAKLNIQKFSIISDEDPAIVSLFKVANTSRKVVHCLNSICGIDQGTKRSILSLRNAIGLCSHLELFKKEYVINSSFDGTVEDGEEDSGGDSGGDEDMNESTLPDAKVLSIFCTKRK